MQTKTIALLSAIVVSLVIAISGCYKSTTIVVNPGSAITTTVSFSNDILPIFSKNCALSGCHVPGGKSPDLSAANAFTSLAQGSYIKANDPDNSVIMLWLTGKKSPVMPLGNGPNQDINAEVYAWINQGAKNN